jgi:hypothetical protein
MGCVLKFTKALNKRGFLFNRKITLLCSSSILNNIIPIITSCGIIGLRNQDLSIVEEIVGGKPYWYIYRIYNGKRIICEHFVIFEYDSVYYLIVDRGS